jgi:hypothetical protein
LSEYLAGRDLQAIEVLPIAPGIEDAFIELMGHTDADRAA